MSADCPVVFSHGKDSGPWGTKISALAGVARRQGLAVQSLDYRGLGAGERVQQLVAHCAGFGAAPVLVGSSMGGYVAVQAQETVPVRGLFLLAPALYMPGYERVAAPRGASEVAVVHGWRDHVIPVEHSIRYAREHGAVLHLLDDDHRLSSSLRAIENLFLHFLEGLLS